MNPIQKSEMNIELLNLSVRTYNCLKKNRINTIGDLLKVPDKEFSGFRNLGVKSLDEINRTINMLHLGEYDFDNVKEKKNKTLNNSEMTLIEYLTGSKKTIVKVLYYDEFQECKEDLNIENLELSVRSANVLKNNGIDMTSQLGALKLKDYNELKGLGNKSKEEIFNKLKNVVCLIYSEKDSKPLYDISEKIFGQYKESSIEFDEDALKSNIFLNMKRVFDYQDIDAKKMESLLRSKIFLKEFYGNNYMGKLLRNHIYNVIKSSDNMVLLEDIRNGLPKHLKNKNVFRIIINDLMEQRMIELVEDGVRIWFPTLLEYISSLGDERKRIVLSNRFQGKTLEETGNQLGITRERIRQIEKKAICNIPRVREDDYQELFETYKWTQELFKYTFNESNLVYGYLSSKYEMGEQDSELIISDESLPVDVRVRAERVIYKDYILVGSTRIKRDRFDILDYVLRTYCKDEMAAQDLSELYYMFLEDFGLEKNEEMIYSERYFETKLANSKSVLWKYGKKLRYYDINAISAETIMKALNLDKYHDVEYSALKFFFDYIEVMEEWDIRDEYELHNLMKKVFADHKEIDINLSRMPNIEFGKIDRDMQVFELLLQVAPVENYELAKQYEQEYGVKSETVLANYFKCIDEFYHNGVYSIDYDILPGPQFDKMKELLVEDMYLLQHVKDIYSKTFPEGDSKLINPYNLKRMGFRVITNLIYSDKYTNAEQYFRYIMTKNDIFDATQLDSRLTCSQTYYHALQMLKNQFEIVEFMPNQFINISRLEQRGITKEKLKEYSDAVYEFGGEEFFTMRSLRQRGFEHPLEELGFDDCFYSGLIRCDERFKSRRIEGNILFRRDADSVTINDLVEYIVTQHRSIDIYDLIDIMKSRYGISIEKFKITYIAREKELYYDAIMEKVYIDYDEYFEEV